MTVQATEPAAGNSSAVQPAVGGSTQTVPSPRRRSLRTPLSAHGEAIVWLMGGALSLCVVSIVGLLGFVVWTGMATFWPVPVEQVTLTDGRIVMGEVTREDTFQPQPTDATSTSVAAETTPGGTTTTALAPVRRRLFRTGNFEMTNRHFEWVSDTDIVGDSETFPEWVVVLEREEWGRFFGRPVRFVIDGAPVADTPETAWAAYTEHHDRVRSRLEERRRVEARDLGALSREREQARLRMREVELDHALPPLWPQAYREMVQVQLLANGGAEDAQNDLDRARTRLNRIERNSGRPDDAAIEDYTEAVARFQAVIDQAESRTAELLAEIDRLNKDNARFQLIMETADGRETAIALDQIVRGYPANQLGFGERLGVYRSRWAEFLLGEPREANSEGGVWPAIVGTVLMTLIMAVLVVPFGVMAAMYLREYAKSGPIVSAVRIAINNLAGVPSIVFGVFGLGFFCYGVGGFIDGGPTWAMPSRAWLLLLAATVAVAASAFGCLMMSIARPGQAKTRRKSFLRYASGGLWVLATLVALLLIATTPFFSGFFQASLPNPTFGKGALIWASFTLALLTLPVVIVATEEALAAVPNSMREGSYACGASKWQTIKRIVLPRAMPGIMTGTILAMARGAGEVAPLMLVGAVKLAPELPLNGTFPFVHAEQSFMHLGFHIFDLGFQSQNSEAAKPLVFTTTLLLILIIAMLNVAAVWLRSRLRRKFAGAQF